MKRSVHTIMVVLAAAMVASFFIACGGGGGGGGGGTTPLTLAGTVTDVNDVVAGGVKVTVINGDTGVSTGLSTVSAGDGSYSIEGIPSGQAFYVNMEGTGYVPTNTENHVLTASELGADIVIVDSTTADNIVPLLHPTGSEWADVEGTTGFIAVNLYKTNGDDADGYFLRPDNRLNMLGFNDGTDDYSGSGIVTHALPADSAPMVMGYEEIHADKLYSFDAQGCSTVYNQDAWINTGEVTIMMFLDLEDACPGTQRLGITADNEDSTISFFNAETMESVGTTDAQCNNPINIVMAADGSEAYVICRDYPGAVSIVSMSAQAVIGTVTLSGDAAYNGVIAPDDYLYVSYDYSAFVSKVLVSGGTPSEVGTIGIATNGGPIVATPDGNYLYVAAHQGDDSISKIDVASGTEIDNWAPGYSYIWDMALDADGRLYLGSDYNWEIPVWNTVTDSIMATTIPTGVAEVANEFELDGTELFISNGLDYNLETDGSALTILDTGLTWDDYDYGQYDDDYYTVTLPFSFAFLGSTYTEVYPGSNGNLDFDSSTAGNYDEDVGNITGFAPFMEDLDSLEAYWDGFEYTGGYYNFSHREFADHVVFSWYTATNDTSDATSEVCVFEVVLYDDDTARMDYLFCMPDAVGEDDGYTYGVGDGSGTDVVDLRATEGSPFELERRSFLWDPAVSTTSLTEVAFQWEGTGADHLPLVNHAHGLALTDDYVFMVMSKDGYWSDTSVNVVEVYNRATMLPAGQITVGYGPRAIAIQP